MAVLTKKNAAAVTRLRVTIPADLAAEIEQIQAAAKARDLFLDVSAICADALARAVKQARAELGQYSGQADGQNAGQQAG